MEQIEKSWDKSKKDAEEADHNVLMVLKDDKQSIVSDKTKALLTDFVLHVFDHIRPNKNQVGNFLDKHAALKYIQSCKDI